MTPCHKVGKNLAALSLCLCVLWKVELVSDKTGYGAEASSVVCRENSFKGKIR